MHPSGDLPAGFGPFRLDRPGRLLLRDGQPVPLGRRAFDTLAALLDADGATLDKDTLLATIWPGLIVEENNLQVQISTLRKALGDGWIITVPGRGYRLSTTPPGSPAPLANPPQLPDLPSLVVLPFANLSGDHEQAYFADGMVEDITAALSRIGGLFVIARNSAFTYKGRTVDVKQVGRDLGVRYVVEGSVRKAGGRVRIACQLIEAATATHLWADRFEGPLDDIFDLQDRVCESVVGAIEPRLQRAEIARAKAKPTENLDAYDLYLRALEQYYLFTEPEAREARRLLRRAVALDANFALAKALISWSMAVAIAQRWARRDDPEAIEALDWARSALAISPDDPSVLGYAGHAVAYLGHDLEAARVALDRAVALNANTAHILGKSGWIHIYLGDFGAAVGDFARAIRLSPRDPELYLLQTGIGNALLHAEPSDPDAALGWLDKALVSFPGWRTARMSRIDCLVKLGRLDEAREAVRDFIAQSPDSSLSAFRRDSPRLPKVKEKVLALRRLACWPE
jgi:adenylate cyclase